MKAIVFSEQGSTEVLRYTDVPKPTFNADEVLVKVEACAVNYLDLHARRNRPEIAEKFQRGETPHILGSDIAGTIAEIGEHSPRCSGWRSGCPRTVYPRAGSVTTAAPVRKTCVTRRNSSASKPTVGTQNM